MVSSVYFMYRPTLRRVVQYGGNELPYPKRSVLSECSFLFYMYVSCCFCFTLFIQFDSDLFIYLHNITEFNLSAFCFRLFHEDFSPIMMIAEKSS